MIVIRCSRCGAKLEEVDDLEVAVALFKKYEACPFCGNSFNGKPKRIFMRAKSTPRVLPFASF
jgi:uncharacterized protein with PIN domain